jgi:predicted enzyme related to lactoylglutathione lyase
MVRQGEMTGGVGASQDGGAGLVTFYVSTDDTAATLRKVEGLGGRVLMPLTEVAPETTIALFADPEGHVVGLM